MLNTIHFVGGATPKTNWKVGLALLIILSVPYLVVVDQAVLSYITTGIVIGALIIFREKLDFAYACYMILIGFICEYTGGLGCTMELSKPLAGGVPPWFIPTFTGVDIILRRRILPLPRPKLDQSI